MQHLIYGGVIEIQFQGKESRGVRCKFIIKYTRQWERTRQRIKPR